MTPEKSPSGSCGALNYLQLDVHLHYRKLTPTEN
jgi:hypothetical protein